MSGVRLENLRKTYGATVAVESITMNVNEGELVAVLGPSGCGKTTTLRMIAGFITPTSGRIAIGDQDVTRKPPYSRDTGMVFQGYALFPHMTVAANVGFGLEMRKVPRAERGRRISEVLRLVRLEGLDTRMPSQLSGGQQQRVALARALVVNPAVFLLDEPLSNLDALLRAEVRLEIRALQRRLGLTTILVTHDQEEALTMADRLVVMDCGRVRQIGTPANVYERPVDTFVARFLGRCTLLSGFVESPGCLRVGTCQIPCVGGEPGQRRALLVRPERVEITAPEAGTTCHRSDNIPGRVSNIVYLGKQIEWHVDTDVGTVIAARPAPINDEPLSRIALGDVVIVRWPARFGVLLACQQ